jgi:hypothetical protein
MDEYEMDAFTRLELETQRTVYLFYGFIEAGTGQRGKGYFKQAHSLGEAMADLVSNAGVDAAESQAGYVVRDAVVIVDENGAHVHVELITPGEMARTTP